MSSVAHAKYEDMFRPAVREGVTLLVGFAGASGSGKTMSAFRMAQGIVGRDKPFAVIDTEARRALHYTPRPGEPPDFVKTFRFDHFDLRPPFRPDAYLAPIRAAAEAGVGAGVGAVVVDSFSHVWESEGGVLDWQEEILRESVERAMKRNDERRSEWQLREAFKRSAWIEPKRAHKVMVQALLQLRAHIILCLRAEDKIDFVKDGERTKVVPMQTLSGFKGWIPICDKRLPFELTASFVLTPDKPGIPQPIKLQEQHRHIFPPDKHIDEDSGKRLADWARGGTSKPPESTSDETAARKAALDGITATLRAHFGSAQDGDAAKAAVCERVFGVRGWKALAALPLAGITAGAEKLDAACRAHTGQSAA